MATELRQVTIEEYWPLIVRNTEEFGQIAVAENPEFNKLASCIYQVLQETFVRDATEYGVGRWENILKISPESGDTLEDRKARILTYLNVKLPYTVRVLHQMLVGLLGEDNFTMTINNDTATLTVAVSLDTTEAQIAEVQTLLERVLPRNLVTEIDPFPSDFTRVEYLESTGTQYSFVPYIWGLDEWCELEAQGTTNALRGFAGCSEHNYMELYISNSEAESYQRGALRATLNTNKKVSIVVNKPKNKTIVSDGENSSENGIFPYRWVNVGTNHYWGLFAFYNVNGNINTTGIARIYSFRAGYADDSLYLCLTPALDNTGAPCMFDTVTRTPFYNSGTGDFLYPGAEQAVQTLDLDLDAKSYAKLTEHGVRRLYHTPEDYNGTMDDYAAENGFKELVEPPAPLEGYWIPEWRETETQLICDWVETEPPTEEVTENE